MDTMANIYILKEVSEVVDLAINCTKKYRNIFIGGNGQKKIMYIQKALDELSIDNIKD